jgi:hypothetical protein
MSNLNNPKHWLNRAEWTRAKAEQFWNDVEKQRMLRIAEGYERLADLAAQRLSADVEGEHKTSQPTPQPSPPLPPI